MLFIKINQIHVTHNQPTSLAPTLVGTFATANMRNRHLENKWKKSPDSFEIRYYQIKHVHRGWKKLKKKRVPAAPVRFVISWCRLLMRIEHPAAAERNIHHAAGWGVRCSVAQRVHEARLASSTWSEGSLWRIIQRGDLKPLHPSATWSCIRKCGITTEDNMQFENRTLSIDTLVLVVASHISTEGTWESIRKQTPRYRETGRRAGETKFYHISGTNF